MDEHVLLLQRTNGIISDLIGPNISHAALSHLRLDHGQTVGPHLGHHPQDVDKLVFSDVLHETIQSDEGPRPADPGAEHHRHTHGGKRVHHLSGWSDLTVHTHLVLSTGQTRALRGVCECSTVRGRVRLLREHQSVLPLFVTVHAAALITALDMTSIITLTKQNSHVPDLSSCDAPSAQQEAVETAKTGSRGPSRTWWLVWLKFTAGSVKLHRQ